MIKIIADFKVKEDSAEKFMEFAKEIFNVPLPERYRWLENRVDERLRQAGASFEDYNDVMGFVERLKGGSNGRY